MFFVIHMLAGLICIAVGIMYVLGALWTQIFEGGSNRVVLGLKRGLTWLFAGSILDLLDVINAWTNPNERNVFQEFIRYAVYVLPLAIGLFVAGWAVRSRSVQRSIGLLVFSFLVWTSVGWAQTVMLYSWLGFALFFR
jgi:hypothetical protein